MVVIPETMVGRLESPHRLLGLVALGVVLVGLEVVSSSHNA